MKKMLRAILKKYAKLLFSLALTASLGFALVASLASGYQSLDDSLNNYLSDYAYPDAVLSTDVTHISEAEKMLSIPGISGCDTRLCGNTMMKTEDGEFLAARILSYRSEERQKFYFWEKTDADGKDSVFLEYHYANSHNIKPGDTVYFRFHDEYRPLFVEGIVSRPETLYTRISDKSWGLNYDFGYVYATIDLLTREFEKDYHNAKAEIDGKADELAGETESAKKDLEDAKKELEDAKLLLEEKKGTFLERAGEAARAKSTLAAAKKKLLTADRKLKKKSAKLDSTEKNVKETRKKLQTQKTQLTKAKDGLAGIREMTKKAEAVQAVIDRIEESEILKYLDYLPQDTSLESLAKKADAFSQILPEVIREGFITEHSETIQSFAVRLNAFFQSLEGNEELKWLYEWSQSPDVQDFLGVLLTIAAPGSAKELISDLGELAALISTNGQAFPDTDLTISDIKKWYKKAREEAEESLSELAAQRTEILNQLAAYGIREDGIDAAIAALNKKIAQCDSGLEQIDTGRTQIAQEYAKIESGLGEIDAALLKIARTDSRLAAAQNEINDAEEQIRSRESELNQKKSDALREFANLKEELKEAYQKLGEEESYDSLCNQFLLYFDENTDAKAALLAAIQSLPKDITVTSSYVYQDSPVKDRIDQNLNPLYSLTVYCPCVFYLITLGILFLFMSMIIRQSRREIGILRALGFSKAKIRSMFCLVSLIVGAAGLLIGCGIACGILRYIGTYFKDFFPLPSFDYSINTGMVIAGAFATLAVCLISTLITTGMISRIMPQEAMSRPQRPAIRVPAWISKLTERMKPINKFSLVSLLRNKGRFLFSAICTAASVMLIFAAISFIASKNEVLKRTFDERIHYDCQIFFDETPDPKAHERLIGLDYLSDSEDLMYYETAIFSNSAKSDAVIHAIEPESRLIGIRDTKGNPLSVREGEIILERHLAEKLHAKEGDTVTAGGVSFTVGAISDQCANMTQYIALSDAQRLGTPDLFCILCNLLQERKSGLLSYLTEENPIDGYLYTIFMDSFYTYNMDLYNTYDTAACILIAFSILIGFVIILNTTMTNMQELKHELCVLLSLGFSRSEISRSRLSHTALQFLIAAPIGLAAGFLFTKDILLKIGSDAEEYIFASGFREYAFTLALVLAYLLISHFVSIRRMKKWDLTENVKDRE